MTDTDTPVAAPPAAGDEQSRSPGSRLGGVVARVAVDAPDRVALVLLWASAVVMATLLLKVYDPYLALVLTVVLTAVSWPLLPRTVAVTQRSLFGSVAAIELVLAWIWANAPYYSQMVSVYRDPAIYALRGWWLTHHSSPVIDMSASLRATVGVASTTVSVGGVPVHGSTAYPQGASLLPGLIAVAGRVGGLRAMLAANLVIGAAALLLVYALARRIVGPLWALLAMVVLAMSMPMVYFSRAPYTEPLAVAAVVGGLLMVWTALERRRLWLFSVGGLLVGVSSIARIDGVLAVTGTAFGIGLASAFARDAARRSWLRLGLLLFGLGGVVMIAAGFYDVSHDSPSYYSSERHNIVPLLEGCLAIFLVTLALTYAPLQGLRSFVARRRVTIARAGAAGVLVVAAVEASRPLWYVSRLGTAVGSRTVGGRQKALGLPVDPRRTYDEHTVSWLGWYLGWPVVISGAIGLALIAYWIVRRRDPRLLMVLTTFSAVAALYLNRVEITPDQIWASRRLLPVVIPGVAIAAAVVPMVIALRRDRRWLAASLGVLLALSPALAWRNLWDRAEFDNELPGAIAACNAIDQVAGPGGSRHVVLAGSPPGTGTWLYTLKIICDADAVMARNVTPQQLAGIRANWGGVPVAVVTFDSSDNVPWTDGRVPAPAYTTPVAVWQQPLTQRPVGVNYIGNTFWVGQVAGDGTVAPLPGAAFPVPSSGGAAGTGG